MDDTVREVVMEFIEKGARFDLDVPRNGFIRIKVSDDVKYLLDRLKVELGYKRVDEIVFDAVVGYLLRRGFGEDCIVRVVSL